MMGSLEQTFCLWSIVSIVVVCDESKSSTGVVMWLSHTLNVWQKTFDFLNKRRKVTNNPSDYGCNWVDEIDFILGIFL